MKGNAACEPNVDFYVDKRAYKDEKKERVLPLTPLEPEWLYNIRPSDLVYCRHTSVDIQAYVPSRFVMQLGFTQGVARSPDNMRLRYGGLKDARNA